MNEPTKVEYRVRTVERYYVTRFEEGANEASSTSIGEYSNADTAYAVAYALAKAEHERLGWAVGDPRIQYPRHPSGEGAVVA
jgi:hypothetical protein